MNWTLAKLLFLLTTAVSSAEARSVPVTYSDVIALQVQSYEESIERYGGLPTQTLAHLASTDPSDVLVIIHGGCWSNAYDWNHTVPMAKALSTMGYDVWVPEYRRVGDAGGGWPGSLDDVIEAIEFVTNKTGKQPILVGHSAGGHLSLRAAQTGLAVGGVVGLAPITDLVAYGAEPGSCQSMVAPFMGDDTFTPDVSYRNASVTLSAITVPVVVVIGKEDPIVRAAQVAVFNDEQVITVENSGHFDVIHPKTEAFSAVLTALETIKTKGQ